MLHKGYHRIGNMEAVFQKGFCDIQFLLYFTTHFYFSLANKNILFYHVYRNNSVPLFIQGDYDLLSMYIGYILCRKGDILFLR